MIDGARAGHETWLRRLVARAAARELTAFVVPGMEVARAYGLDLEAAGLRVVATPRHASVLLLAGEIPGGLAGAVVVAYAQMPRPRAVLALGSGMVPPLPAPDVAAPLGQDALSDAVARLRRLFAAGSWREVVSPFDVPQVHAPAGDQNDGMDHGNMNHEAMGGTSRDDQRERQHGAEGSASENSAHEAHHAEIGHDERGGSLEAGEGHAVHGASGEDHGEASHAQLREADDHKGKDSGGEKQSHGQHGGHGDMEHMQHGGHGDMEHMQHGGTEHEDMTHGDMGGMGHGDMDGGFMSMVMMTKDLPRSSDGLPMEWLEAPFGPLFPGLPGGLMLTFTLDGDTVARARLTPGTLTRGLAAAWPGPAADFPARFARLDPLAPMAYRILAERALDAAAERDEDEELANRRVGALEHERVLSHLSWLAAFGSLLGVRALAGRAADLGYDLRRAQDAATAARTRTQIAAFVRMTPRIPLLTRRLDSIGRLSPPDATRAGGPITRAAGEATDARLDDPAYRRLGFEPVVRDGNDALARLQVRLAEMMQSIDLAFAAGTFAARDWPGGKRAGGSGTGTATVETPRGPATLGLMLEGEMVRDVTLTAPATRHGALVAGVAEGQELADALVGVASLDLSPWEMDQ